MTLLYTPGCSTNQNPDCHLPHVVILDGIGAIVSPGHVRTFSIQGSNVGGCQHQDSSVVDVTESGEEKLHSASKGVNMAARNRK